MRCCRAQQCFRLKVRQDEVTPAPFCVHLTYCERQSLFSMLSMLAAGVQTSLWGEALVVSTPLPAVSLSGPSSRGAKEDIAIDPRHTGILVEGMPTQGVRR